jgi:diguanylate cyclase (GGDEF)-like protein/PAS domain S-box-containing protein
VYEDSSHPPSETDASTNEEDSAKSKQQLIQELIQLRHQVLQQNQQIQEVTEFNHQVIADVPVGLIIYNRELRYQLWNRFMEQLSGLPAAAMLDRYPLEAFPDLQDNGIYACLHRALAGEVVVLPEVPFAIADTGRSGWTSVSFNPLRDAHGEITGVLGVVRDISDRKQIEAEQQQTAWVLQQQMQRQRLLGLITQQIRQSLDLDRILSVTVNQVRRMLDADRVVIFRLGTGMQGRVVAESVDAIFPKTLGMAFTDECFPPDSYEFYWQGRTRSIVNVEETYQASCLQTFLESIAVKSKAVIPIVQSVQEESSSDGVSLPSLWGLLIVHACQDPRYWQPEEMELLRQIDNQLAIAIHQSELYHQLQQANSELKRLVTLDGLTQIANRRYFDDYLGQEWHRLKREQLPLSLLLCDVDYFKAYNDYYGHQAGDRCLQEIAQAIAAVTKRTSDLVARYGGEEFTVVLPNTSLAGAIQVAQQIQSAIAKLQLPHQQSPLGSITLSIGITSTIPTPPTLPEQLVATADAALYAAKDHGRNVCCVRLLAFEEAAEFEKIAEYEVV